MPLTITFGKTATIDFTVEVAATPDEQERGLMFRRSLAADRGMIFPYDPPQDVGFWMKNTLIPLDIIFIRADGTIARIATRRAARPDAGAVWRAGRGGAGNRAADARPSSASRRATRVDWQH